MKLTSQQMASIESEILKQVRAHPGVSRVMLARKLQIAASTVSNYTGRLITEGFLIAAEESSEKASSEAGRPPVALRLNPDGGQFIGVDFEARSIMAMALDFSDRPLKQARQEIQTSDSVADIIKKIEQAIVDVLPGQEGRLLAIGVGVPGLVNPAEGVAVHYQHIKDWRNVPLTAPLAQRFGVPVYLKNNAHSTALAELWFGQGRGLTDWLCIINRSGIGVGVVAGGHLRHGAEHRAGEIGRLPCPELRGPAARFFPNSAFPMELQEVASVRAILAALERARQNKEPSLLSAHEQPLVFADVVSAAKQRDRLALQVIEAAAEMLGWAVGALALALNPSKVILSGPLTELGDILLQPLQKRIDAIMQVSNIKTPLIVNSTMGEYSGALGAAALALEEWKPAR